MFAGLISHKPAKKPSSWLSTKNWQKALYPLIEPELTGEFCDDRFRVVESDRYNTPWSKCLSTVPLVEDDIVCAFWGRIDNRQEIEEQLGLAKPVREISDTELLCAAWSKWGEAVPNHLHGDFSLAIYDKAAKSLFIARDRLGIRPFYYWAHKDAFFFTTTPVALKCLKG